MYDKKDSDGTFRYGQQKIMFFLLVICFSSFCNIGL